MRQVKRKLLDLQLPFEQVGGIFSLRIWNTMRWDNEFIERKHFGCNFVVRFVDQIVVPISKLFHLLQLLVFLLLFLSHIDEIVGVLVLPRIICLLFIVNIVRVEELDLVRDEGPFGDRIGRRITLDILKGIVHPILGAVVLIELSLNFEHVLVQLVLFSFQLF